jgi:hypothetical protein
VVEEAGVPKRTTDHEQATGTLRAAKRIFGPQGKRKLLKMALKHQKSNQIRCSFSEQIFNSTFPDFYFKKSNV